MELNDIRNENCIDTMKIMSEGFVDLSCNFASLRRTCENMTDTR